jgi:hypothetical protein
MSEFGDASKTADGLLWVGFGFLGRGRRMIYPETKVVVMSESEFRRIISEEVTRAMDASKQSGGEVQLVSRKQLADSLSCSLVTVRAMVREGMPFVRVGKADRFHVNACIGWIRDRSGALTPENAGSIAGVELVSVRQA